MTFTASQLSLLGEFRQLAELEAKATPGPWEWDGDATNDTEEFRKDEAPWLLSISEGGSFDVPVITGDIHVCHKADMEFIQASRAGVLALLKRVVELGERVKELEGK